MIALCAALAVWLCLAVRIGKGTTYANDYLLLAFQNSNIATIGDSTGLRGSSTAGSLYLGLYTADPGAGSQATNETVYTGYARLAVARSSSGFTVSAQTMTLAAAATFAAGAPTDTDVLTFWGLGVASTGAGLLMYSGPIGVNLGAGIGQSGNNITIPGLTGVAVGNQIVFAVPAGGTIPTGLTAGTVYFVKTLSSDVITVSTTSGGSVVAISADGQVLAYKVTPITMGQGGLAVTPQLTTGTTIIEH